MIINFYYLESFSLHHSSDRRLQEELKKCLHSIDDLTMENTVLYNNNYTITLY